MNITEIIDKNKQLQQENNELKEKLKKYTAPSRRKRYYRMNCVNIAMS
jgi:regulator of replication initiation timing